MTSWLAHWLGLDDPSGPVYLAWSGVGGDVTEFAILAGLIQMYRRHVCHVDRCHRIGIRKVAGTEHTVCHRHHPNPNPTHAQILADHEAAKA